MHLRFWYAGLYLHFSELCVVNSGRSFVIHSSSQKRAVSNLAVTWKRCHIAQDSFYLFCFLFCNIKHAHDCSSFRPTSVWNKEGEACFYFHFEFVSSPFHTSALKMNLCSKHTQVHWCMYASRQTSCIPPRTTQNQANVSALLGRLLRSKVDPPAVKHPTWPF